MDPGKGTDATRFSLATASADAARRLGGLCAQFRADDYEHRTNLTYAVIDDQVSRFQIWCGNLGALQRLPSTASLDYRLRDTPKIAFQILQLLDDLCDTLTECKSFHRFTRDLLSAVVSFIASGERPNRIEETDVGNDHDVNYDIASVDNEDEFDKVQLSEAEELFGSLKDTIAGLFRLAMVIRKSSPRDRYDKALSGANPFGEVFDVAHVSHKFPKLAKPENAWLKERLGKALSQRRRYLQYAREHRRKLAEHNGPHGNLDEEDIRSRNRTAHSAVALTSEAGVTAQTERTSTSAPTAASTMALPDQTIQDTNIQDDQSQTSFAVSLIEDTGKSQLQLPSLLDVSGGATSFECPFCWTIQSIRKESTWRKHAFTDLRPYVCTWEHCDVKIFADRRDWFEHELKCHRQRWPCQFACQTEFKTVLMYQTHLKQTHLFGISDDQLAVIAQASARSVNAILAADCPFCDEWHASLQTANPTLDSGPISVTPLQFRHHVGHHMQDLALFAIPRGYLEAREPGTGSTVGSQVAAAGSNVGSETASLPQDLPPADELPQSFTEGRAIDIPHCIQVLRKASMGSRSTIRHYITHILPRLDGEDLHYVRSSISFSSLLRPFSLGENFKYVSEAIMLGPWGSDALWLRKWLTVSRHSRYWWILLNRLVIGRSADAYDHINNCLRSFDTSLVSIIERAFDGTTCPNWLIRSLVFLVIKGQTPDSADIPDLRTTIGRLELTFTNTDRRDSVLEANMKWFLSLSNRHLRDLIRMYPRLTGGKLLASRLDAFLTGHHVSQFYPRSHRRR